MSSLHLYMPEPLVSKSFDRFQAHRLIEGDIQYPLILRPRPGIFDDGRGLTRACHGIDLDMACGLNDGELFGG